MPGQRLVKAATDPTDVSMLLHFALAANSRDLLAYLERRVDVREDAADLLGETMLVAWRRVARLPPDAEGARMWLFVIARTTLRNYSRGRRRQVQLAATLRREVRSTAIAPDTAEALDVRRAIAELPRDLAELVRLVHWDGFPLAEAARLLGIPASTARGRYARARSELSSRLPAYDNSPAD
ncbi:MAG: hypothetical protein QOH69_2292 [Actinomycetota bacterium]|jgi:RNA polymerase sigma-70 factor (ECF subfamily)|nr:hypothetical protein [Actinomycetota bacterium]